MSLNFKPIAQGLVAMVENNIKDPNGVAVKCIVNRTNAFAPGVNPEQRVIPDPYFTLEIVSPPAPDGSEDMYSAKMSGGVPTDDGIHNIYGQRRFTASFTAYAHQKQKQFYDPMDMALSLQDLLHSPHPPDELIDIGVSVWQTQPVLDVTLSLESGYEPRAQFDAIMGVAVNREQDLGLVESAEYSGTFNEGESDEVTIPSTTVEKE